MSVDNRTMINDCEQNTGWVGSDTATVTTLTGQFFEGISSLSTQLTNADEQMHTTDNSASTPATFSLDWSDSTLYMVIKNNLAAAASAGGIQFVIGDGTNLAGYDIGGVDAPGMPLSLYFFSQKLDVSVIAASPGIFTDYTGTEGSMSQTAITQIGYGGILAIKAQGPVDNVFMDAFRYIANGSYALTVNGGTTGTPETMTDLVGDDENPTNGWGMVSNPFGETYLFGAPTEWGNVSTVAEHAFAASDQSWFLYGDNGGGHAVAVTHFPFRFISNSTDTGEIKLTNVIITGLGTRSEWLMDNADFNTIELESCTFNFGATIALPSSGGTSRFTTNCTFNDCDQITHNGADMSGSSVLVSNVAAGSGALLYNETADPDGETDNMTFSQGATAHSAFEFGTAVTANMTLRGIDFTGFGSTDDVDGAVFLFLATSGSLNLNLIGCTTDGTFSVDDTAGIAITVVIDPVTTLVNVKDNNGANLINTRVLLEAADGAGDFAFEASVTIVSTATTATVTHTSHPFETGDIAVIRGADQQLYNGAYAVTDTGANTYTYTMTGDPVDTATGTIISSGAIIDGLTDGSGNISTSRTFTLPTIVKGVARKSTASPRFKSFPLAGTISTTLGLTINIQMIIDE